MSGRGLTEKEAIELITPIVDNEVDKSTRTAFFRYIRNNPSVYRKYESTRRVKEIISNRCPCASAPLHLKEKIFQLLPGTGQKTIADETPVYDMPTSSPLHSSPHDYTDLFSGGGGSAIYKVAAIIMIAALLGGIYFFTGERPTAYSIEEHANIHFEQLGGRMVPPTISTASIVAAELELAESFGIAVTVPSLSNADFLGVVYTNFVDGFKTPMFEYYLPADDEYIYIFAFQLDDISSDNLLKRSAEAIASCVNESDYHISDVNGRHIVSWKWNDIWYAAVSNHNGETLASMVGPLQDN